MISNTEKERCSIQTEIAMRGNGWKAKEMDMDLIFSAMELYIEEISWMERNMDQGPSALKMELRCKPTGLEIILKAKERFTIKMGTISKAHSIFLSNKVKVYTIGMIPPNTKVFSKKIWCQVSQKSTTNKANTTKAPFLKAEKKEKGITNTSMETNSKANGKTIKNIQDNIHIKMVAFFKVNSAKAKCPMV